jgi:hypothetical protein
LLFHRVVSSGPCTSTHRGITPTVNWPLRPGWLAPFQQQSGFRAVSPLPKPLVDAALNLASCEPALTSYQYTTLGTLHALQSHCKFADSQVPHSLRRDLGAFILVSQDQSHASVQPTRCKSSVNRGLLGRGA